MCEATDRAGGQIEDHSCFFRAQLNQITERKRRESLVVNAFERVLQRRGDIDSLRGPAVELGPPAVARDQRARFVEGGHESFQHT
jgi:hypothetical protein